MENNMQCSNRKCKKRIINYYLCKPCNKSYCSNSCLNNHNLEEHKLNNKSVNNNINNDKSVFMKQGVYIQELKTDSYFHQSNFEFMKKSGKRVLIGEGAFAQIYLVRHKQSNKEYAIKLVRTYSFIL